MTRDGGVALRVVAAIAVVFGLLTIVSGGNALFGGAEARARMGQVVPFVLVFNFVAGFAYVVAGLGLWFRKYWAAWLAAAIFAGSLVVLLLLGLHALQGGGYEMRTVLAMLLRCAVWAMVATVALWALARRAKPNA
jgi:hypothetical protein